MFYSNTRSSYQILLDIIIMFCICKVRLKCCRSAPTAPKSPNSSRYNGAAMFGCCSGSSAQIVLSSTFLRICLLSLLTRITSALIVYDKRILLDIGHRYTNLLQDTLFTNPTWPLEFLRNTEENNGHLNKPQRRRIKKHHGKWAGISTDVGKELTVLLYRESCSLMSLVNKMDDLRARISFQRDKRDCNILCLNETWLMPSVPDTAVTPSDNFSVLRLDRTAKAGKTKGGGVCFMINKKWCDPRNISILSC